MGNIVGLFDRIVEIFNFHQQDVRILLVGLDAAGKSTIVQRLKLGEVRGVAPTVGFNVEQLYYKSMNMVVWDMGGQNKLRGLWKFYYPGTKAIVFVVDSSDTARFEEAKYEIQLMNTEPLLDGVPFLIYSNKMDVIPSVPPSTVAEQLGLDHFTNRKWMIQPSCALTGAGLKEGLTWLCDALK